MDVSLDPDILIKRRYEIIAPIASGGMAVVARAWDHVIGRYVAVKALRAPENPEIDPYAVERFRREAQAAARITHPNVVAIYDFIEENTRQYLVMEYVDGINLKRLVAEQGPFPVSRALAITEQICAALAAAHARGIIHRDIKPQNILLTPDGRARLTDFGIVRVSGDDALTRSGIILGTADYLSPEQARGERLTPQTDLYSLGVVLYEMLTGVPPFAGDSPVTVARLHATMVIPPLAEMNPDLPAGLEAVLRKAVEREPRRRYRTAIAMGQAMRAFRMECSGPGRSLSEIGWGMAHPTRQSPRHGSLWQWLADVFVGTR
jgi:serine/threonine protein kinase